MQEKSFKSIQKYINRARNAIDLIKAKNNMDSVHYNKSQRERNYWVSFDEPQTEEDFYIIEALSKYYTDIVFMVPDGFSSFPPLHAISKNRKKVFPASSAHLASISDFHIYLNDDILLGYLMLNNKSTFTVHPCKIEKKPSIVFSEYAKSITCKELQMVFGVDERVFKREGFELLKIFFGSCLSKKELMDFYCSDMVGIEYFLFYFHMIKKNKKFRARYNEIKKRNYLYLKERSKLMEKHTVISLDKFLEVIQ